MNDGHDDKLSADIRRLMGDDTTPRQTPRSPAPQRQEQPLLLTDPIEEPPPPAPAPDAAPIDRSIGGALAKLNAREAAQSANAGDGQLSVSNRSLDALVQEALRPLLTEWLDRNLDRVVREQVDAALREETAGREPQTY